MKQRGTQIAHNGAYGQCWQAPLTPAASHMCEPAMTTTNSTIPSKSLPAKTFTGHGYKMILFSACC
jgi:hypothetical protein